MCNLCSDAAPCLHAARLAGRRHGAAVALSQPGMRPCVAGFTLIELLVVVTIIAILASMLLPSLGKAKARVQVASCQNNLRQLGHALFFYAGDWDEFGPTGFDNNNSYLYRASTVDGYLIPNGYSSIANPPVMKSLVCPAFASTSSATPGAIAGGEVKSTYNVAFGLGNRTTAAGNEWFGWPDTTLTNGNQLYVQVPRLAMLGRSVSYVTLTLTRTHTFLGPSLQPMGGDCSYGNKSTGAARWDSLEFTTHQGTGCNAMFFDGHAAWAPFIQMKKYINAPSTTNRTWVGNP